MGAVSAQYAWKKAQTDGRYAELVPIIYLKVMNDE